MAVASQGAIPGDALYPVKRAIENTQAGFSVGDDAKGETLLGNASERLDEVDKLSQRARHHDAKLVTQTLNDFTQQFTDASDSLIADYEPNGNEASIGQIHENAADSLAVLSELDGVVPPAAHDALLDAAQRGHRDRLARRSTSAPTAAPGSSRSRPRCWPAPPALVDGLTDTLAGGELPGASRPERRPDGRRAAAAPERRQGPRPPERP